ncbi:hypothetical protein PGO_080700 [Plasmodium gonderi]|uniref:AP-5 complex subunit sigma-1 n=1 Tax=Plasmodium gonderi TaxID=77519 RepID=A0A1Y1JDE2_PLAGO|nr:hypothetical protein PGO_080700 [Plasmodium gonderi]GAW80506.1 hypothetical protein PGO_080700 [Plasmodium gonderi]
MVYGIIIHSSECAEKFYFSSYYSMENNDEDDCIRQRTIVARVIDEINYYEDGKAKSDNTNKSQREKYLDLLGSFLSKNVNNEVKIDNEGFFRIVDSSLFKNKINILWKVLNKICYTLVLYAHENIHLADYFLHTFINVMREHHDMEKRKNSKNDVDLFNPDTVLAVLYFFLPKGQLMLIDDNHAKILSTRVQQFLGGKVKLPPKNS